MHISSTSASISPEPCKLRYIITCHLAKACIYRQLLHPSRPGCLSGPSLFPVLVACICLTEISPFLLVNLPQLALFGWGGTFGASGGLWRPPAASGALRRPPAASGALLAPSGALRHTPARPSAPGALLSPPSGALRRPPAPSSTLLWPPLTLALWKESCNGKACTMRRDLREGGVNARLVLHIDNFLDLILNETPLPHI